jgi:6-pyruvoyltetrahydropterin/6-carboxytetrahydropterin synthase
VSDGSATGPGRAEIWREFGFEAAHRLPNVPEGHKCARLHGHSFRVSVHVEGRVGDDSGWVCDFAEIADACAPVRAGLDNPTSEVLAAWIWERLAPSLPGLTRVVVRETCTSGVEYRGR